MRAMEFVVSREKHIFWNVLLCLLQNAIQDLVLEYHQ